ncbi:MAG TPA: filamin/ABP280 repeat domain-containing protein [Thermoanaerobaculia bacterium]|nr:filamin/ABP280 repeat domain-containing protein [Thermoanaerobaculia bacterium]
MKRRAVGLVLVAAMLSAMPGPATPLPQVSATPTKTIVLSVNGPATSTVLCNLLVLPSSVAGEEATFIIQARDASNHKRTAGGDTFVARLAGPETVSVSITDRRDGTYAGRYTALRSGPHTLSVMRGNLNILGSPFTVVVGSGITSASLSSLLVLPTVAAGGTGTFLIQARNQFGVKRDTGGDVFVARLSGPATPPVSVADQHDGTYRATFLVSGAGTYTVDVLFGGLPISGSPFRFEAR